MESAGVYWKPIYILLEATGMELLVVNARPIKAVPRRKTDVKDAEWMVAHSIPEIAYHILRDGTVYQELGPDYADERSKEAVKRRAIK